MAGAPFNHPNFLRNDKPPQAESAVCTVIVDGIAPAAAISSFRMVSITDPNSHKNVRRAVLARMRSRGESLSEAARFEHTTPRTVRKVVGKQLKRGASGHYSATRSDTLRRELNVLGFDGYEPVVVHSSKQAHLVAEHLIAVGRFLRTGDTEWLKPFLRKRVGGVDLLTDPDRLHILADADLVKLDALYRQNRGQGQGE